MVMTYQLNQGHVLDVLRGMDAGSVHCVVTSPPYWGLRDYGLKPVVWSDGWEGSLGLEPTPELYVQHVVEVFREIKRVLRDDGTVWLNMGDCYSAASTHGGDNKMGPLDSQASMKAAKGRNRRFHDGLKPKDLVGLPWLVAFALRDDGWWLRSDIVWAKKNPMPESVRDRPTRSHEYVFLLSKSKTYYYDQDAVREIATEGRDLGLLRGRNFSDPEHVAAHAKTIQDRQEAGINSRTAGTGYRNLRSVWHLATQPFPAAHFATYPEKLVEPCIKAGTSQEGCCPKCGAPWARVVEKKFVGTWHDHKKNLEQGSRQDGKGPANKYETPTTLGWRPTCECDAGDPVRCTVLDPFCGSGTTGVVALRLGRNFIGIELNEEYCEMVRRRILDDAPLLNQEATR